METKGDSAGGCVATQTHAIGAKSSDEACADHRWVPIRQSLWQCAKCCGYFVSNVFPSYYAKPMDKQYAETLLAMCGIE